MEAQEKNEPIEFRGMAVAYLVHRYSQLFSYGQALVSPLRMADIFSKMRKVAEQAELPYILSIVEEYELAIRDLSKCLSDDKLPFPERPEPVRIRRRQLELSLREGGFIKGRRVGKPEKDLSELLRVNRTLEELRGPDILNRLLRIKVYCDEVYPCEGHYLKQLWERSLKVEERLLDDDAFEGADEVAAFRRRVWQWMEELDREVRGTPG